MPKKIPEILIHFLEDCLSGNPYFTYKAMFGGYGIYKNGSIFSILIDGQIYFKVGDNNVHDYRSLWKLPFTYTKKWWKICSLSYYELPEEILEDNVILHERIDKSLSVMKKNTKKSSISSEMTIEDV